MSDVARFIDSLWQDLAQVASFPQVAPLLAHYTSIATLSSIVHNNEIWFSNPLVMNDYEELRFGMNEGRVTCPRPAVPA